MSGKRASRTALVMAALFASSLPSIGCRQAPPSPQTPAEFVTAYSAAYRARDADAIMAHCCKLSLEDHITKFFPKAPPSWRDITIRHLLTHTSGIKNHTDEALDMRRDYTDDQLLALAMKSPLDFTPGERWSYSNTGRIWRRRGRARSRTRWRACTMPR